TKMLLSGGGSLIQDATSSKSLTYYLYIMKLAKKLGAKLYVYANGIGPLKEKNLSRASKTLKLADMITLREAESLKELERLGISDGNIMVTADPALIFEGNPEDALGVMKAEGISSDKKLFGISVRSWQECDGGFNEKIAALADYVYEKYGLVPVFIPMRYPHDVKISEEIAALVKCESHVLKDELSVKEIMGLTASCEAVLGMRLHTLIFASGSAVPVVGLVYDKKVSGFLDYIGQNRSVDVFDMDIDAAKVYIDEIMESKAEISQKLSEKREELKALAYKNAEIAVKMLEEGI
ncbi:MAG: polysaccharide pyruvyl transferase family protein, partial [Clostridia bacterium]|nr:polysaccharide pyruvyl transferase family protein [Clostridia bacterium]